MYKTFNEWSKSGYKIKKGSKATWINDVPMFDESQVQKTKKPSYANHWIGCTPKGTAPHWDYDEEDERTKDAIYGFDGW